MKRLIALAAVAALASTPAFAHAHLIAESPAANAVVTSPLTLVLRFSEGVQLAFTGIVLDAPDGKALAVGTGTLDPSSDTILTVPINGKLAVGHYAVTWHALSTDGHKTTGSYGFTVKP